MEKVKVKAEKSREHREKIELLEGTISLAGEPTPFRAYVPQGEIIKYGQDSKSGAKAPRLMYKVEFWLVYSVSMLCSDLRDVS